MKRSSISFVCQECGYDTPQWLGKCPECGVWNSLKEIKLGSKSLNSSIGGVQRSGQIVTPKRLSEITYKEEQRLSTGFYEMDSVLGGGIVKGSVTLLAGDPGIGKSTLLLQLGLIMASKKNELKETQGAKAVSGSSVLYISGEESEEQIKLRAQRLSQSNDNKNFLLLSINDTNQAISAIETVRPALVIIDSIQTMESQDVAGLSGSIGQIRYAASMFIRAAKTLGVPLIIVGHVTKDGMVAGPMILSHMVDTVLFLEGEKITATRILRSFKNRFGPVDEVGIFTMGEKGMEEVKNPEQVFLTEKRKNVPGSVFVVTLEGTRAFLVEIQALVVFSKLPLPRRVVSGIDQRRLELLLAVLQKHCSLPIGTMDVFVNVVGGLKISDPAVDLGICLALFSSLKNVGLGKTVGISEVGLLGELRHASFLEKRIKEAKKLGFNNIISSQTHRTLGEVIRLLS